MCFHLKIVDGIVFDGNHNIGHRYYRIICLNLSVMKIHRFSFSRLHVFVDLGCCTI